MLTELRIKNFALIDKLEIELTQGLNVLTGETGAGKSIIIDAVSLLLGGRASQEFIRSGTEKTLVEGCFRLESSSQVSSALLELGYELEDELLLLSRELSTGGKNTCRVQGKTVPLNLYREIGTLLIDIHGQHDYQSLLRPENHLALLDSFGEELTFIKEQVHNYSQAVMELRAQLVQLCGDDKDLARREDMLRFQLEEIGSANLQTGEEEDLLQERQRLVNAEKLSTLTQTAYEKLFSGWERQKSAFDLAGSVVANLKELAGIDARVSDLVADMESAYYQLEEVASALRTYSDEIVFDPQRQEQVEDRLTLMRTLKRKYGNSIAEVLAFYQQVAAELEKLDNQEQLIDELNHRLAQDEAKYNVAAENLTTARKKAAERLEKEVSGELADLNMPGTSFVVQFSLRDKVSRLGRDVVEFMFSPNPGEPEKSLVKTASGGELSRIILALKTILAKIDPVPTLIFDEVDSGVGGAAVRKVAEKLGKIAETRQVLCVTHSPQIASFADKHFYISKNAVENRTVTNV
ncbi:MAG TPA: DNA repair protein RecN, partial [Verrucomicrobiae bacterium]|nr:DNA repair protein RecN [Verrucomicrobiae bacterium]